MKKYVFSNLGLTFIYFCYIFFLFYIFFDYFVFVLLLPVCHMYTINHTLCCGENILYSGKISVVGNLGKIITEKYFYCRKYYYVINCMMIERYERNVFICFDKFKQN